MFSLQTIFGKGDKFYGLLEASAAAARESTRALTELLATPAPQRSLEKFALARQREKNLAAQISQELVNTFVTALEREDIDALSSALYKIPKIIEKFAERYVLASERLGDVDFAPRAAMLERASEVIEQMVGLLRKGMNIAPMPPKVMVSVRQRILEKYGKDISICPTCNKGIMVLMETIRPRRSQQITLPLPAVNNKADPVMKA